MFSNQKSNTIFKSATPMSGDPPPPPNSSKPKRVILRLRVDDFSGRDWSEYDDAIRSYLSFAGRPTDREEIQKHYAHIEPFQAPELNQTSFHITLDMEKDGISKPNPDFNELPHEVYRVRKDGEGIL